MASTKEYLDFILEQLSGLNEITYKASEDLVNEEFEEYSCGR